MCLVWAYEFSEESWYLNLQILGKDFRIKAMYMHPLLIEQDEKANFFQLNFLSIFGTAVTR